MQVVQILPPMKMEVITTTKSMRMETRRSTLMV